jgi:hypothetical protein
MQRYGLGTGSMPTENGKPEMTALVGIFEAGPDVTPATVARQKE